VPLPPTEDESESDLHESDQYQLAQSGLEFEVHRLQEAEERLLDHWARPFRRPVSFVLVTTSELRKVAIFCGVSACYSSPNRWR
jgi:hypothetical protein